MSRDQIEPYGVPVDSVEVAGLLDLTVILPTPLDSAAFGLPVLLLGDGTGTDASGRGSGADWFFVPGEFSAFVVPADPAEDAVPPGVRKP